MTRWGKTEHGQHPKPSYLLEYLKGSWIPWHVRLWEQNISDFSKKESFLNFAVQQLLFGKNAVATTPFSHLRLLQWFVLKTSEQRSMCMPACVSTCMYNRVFTLSEQFRSIIKSVIYLGVCLLFRMTCILADDRAHIAQKAAALHIVPSPTYPKVSEPYTTWISTFKLCGWVTLRVNSNPIRNHGPIQTSQSPKSDNSLSKGQNVDAERKKKRKKKEESRINQLHT